MAGAFWSDFRAADMGCAPWNGAALLRWADVVVLHQIKLSALEAGLFGALSRRRVFDVDDAIYVRKPRRLGEPVRRLDMASPEVCGHLPWVDVVAAGNDVLACSGAAAARAKSRYCRRRSMWRLISAATARPTDPPTIVWIGSPENLIYLEMIRPALARLAARHPALQSARRFARNFPAWPEINVERVAGVRRPRPPRSRRPTSASCR